MNTVVREAILTAMGQALPATAAAALADALPREMAEPLRASRPVGSFDRDELVTRAAGRAQVSHAAAELELRATAASIADELPPAQLSALRDALPASIAAIFPTPVEPAAPRRRSAGHTTLAEGRPGSAHPLSEARPQRAHADSVARADNPHGEDKLSSAHGLTQEREHESLATGREGSTRPLSRAR